MWDDPDDEQDFQYERDCHALAQLLQARGEGVAAGIVAVSRYSTAYVGNDGWRVTLAVPAQLYDAARTDFRNSISAACEEIVGPDEFEGLAFRVLRPPYEDDWVATVVEALATRRVHSERVIGHALNPADVGA